MRFAPLATSALALMLATAPTVWAQETAAPQAAPETGTETAEMADIAYDADTVLATVNGNDITLGHVAIMVARLPEQYQKLADQDLLDGILQQLVEQELLKDAMEARGPLHKGLQLSVENELRALLAQEIANEFFAAPISDEEMQDGYQKATASIPPQVEYSAAHILVETEDEAKALIAALEGGADFTELAKEKSVGPSGPDGGDLGWFGPGQMVPEFEEAVAGLEAGAVSAPVQTQFGWHVIKLNETREKPLPTFESLAEAIEDKLRRDKVDTEIAKLKEAGETVIKTEGFPPAAIRDMSIFDEE